MLALKILFLAFCLRNSYFMMTRVMHHWCSDSYTSINAMNGNAMHPFFIPRNIEIECMSMPRNLLTPGSCTLLIHNASNIE